MKNILLTFWQICTLKRGPQDLPYSPTLLNLTISINWLVGFAILSFNASMADAAWKVLILVIGNLLLLKGLLLAAQKNPRFTQSATALFGTNTLISTIAVLIISLIVWLNNLGISWVILTNRQVYLFAAFCLGLWTLIVSGSIFRHILEKPLWQGVLVAFFFELALRFIFSP